MSQSVNLWLRHFFIQIKLPIWVFSIILRPNTFVKKNTSYGRTISKKSTLHYSGGAM